MELSQFLLARIAEDEAVARAATQSAKWWDWPGRDGRREAKVRAHEDPYIALNVTNGDATHIARHDPARVLAECDAKRRIVAMMDDPHRDTYEVYAVLRALALPYADHDDYDEAWRP